jgi:hypothetical protein
MAKDTKYNKTLIAMWETKNGNAFSMPVDQRSLDQIRGALEAVELGGKLLIKRVSEEARQKFKNPANAPTFFLEYMSKEQVQEWEEKNPRNRDREGGL